MNRSSVPDCVGRRHRGQVREEREHPPVSPLGKGGRRRDASGFRWVTHNLDPPAPDWAGGDPRPDRLESRCHRVASRGHTVEGWSDRLESRSCRVKNQSDRMEERVLDQVDESCKDDRF